jgi:hypothetical protein
MQKIGMKLSNIKSSLFSIMPNSKKKLLPNITDQKNKNIRHLAAELAYVLLHMAYSIQVSTKFYQWYVSCLTTQQV